MAEQLVASLAGRNGVLAAGAVDEDRPAVLALNELRLVLRLAQAYGAADDPPERLPELAVALGAGFSLRAVVRLAPGARWPVKAAIAYAGTRALGEAARLRFELTATPQRAGAEHAAL